MTPIALVPTAKILVVKLADLGDVLTATPALRALRRRYPHATIDVLLTHHTQPALAYSTWADNLIPSDNFRFFTPRDALKPDVMAEGLQLLKVIRQKKYDAVIILHHLTTRAGALKYAAIARAGGAKIVAGLHPPGKRGAFLTHFAPDGGFGKRHEVDYWLDVVAQVDAPAVGREMDMAFSADDATWARTLLRAENHHSPVVVIHPGSGGFSTARRWSARHFAAVADALIADGATVALVGTPTDGIDAVQAAMTRQAVDLSGQTSLHQLAALISQAQLFIGGDSGVSHIAAATGVPMVSIFGPTNEAAWGATGAQQIILRADIPCAPCAYIGHSVGLRHGCDAKTCLKLITPEQVLRTARKLLNDETPARPVVIPPERPAEHATILGVTIDAVTFQSALAKIETFIAEGRPHQICTVNPEFVVAAQRDHLFRRVINRASMAFADGAGLLLAARWLGETPLPERIAGVDMVEALAQRSAERGYRLYFLGAQPGVAEKAIATLRERYPKMKAVGAFAGSPRAEDEDALVEKIRAAAPDVVFVAYGAPKQDKWIARNMHRLPGGVFIGVGGAFDFIAGTAQRAPKWVQRIGLEWLHRLVMQPWRWRRIWNAVPRFLWLIFKSKIGLGEYYDD